MPCMAERIVLAVVNLKGGTSKTTTAVFLAHALHELGRSVVLVDADPQASALTWKGDAPEPFPFPVVGMPAKDLHRQLLDLIRPEVDAVVIDTPPLDKGTGIVLSALRAATAVVVPMAPTPMEYDRLKNVRETVEDAGGLHPSGGAPPLAVLLTRTVAGASSTGIYRDQVVSDGVWCLAADVRRLERFAQAYGDNVTATGTAYAEAAAELIKGRKS